MNGKNFTDSGRTTFATDPVRMGVCNGSPMVSTIKFQNSLPRMVRRRPAKSSGYNYTIMG